MCMSELAASAIKANYADHNLAYASQKRIELAQQTYRACE